MREVLEATLMKHCTLTQGDYLELEYNGTIHELKVHKMLCITLMIILHLPYLMVSLELE